MYYNQSSAPRGASFARRMHHPFYQSNQRAPVNIYKTENSFELMVFAPGRVKENFQVNVVDKELVVSYQPAPGIPQPEWLQREYSRGGFERRFITDDNIDTSNIKATYTDGVLQISLPLIPGKETPKQEVPIN
jgi:HSP20 family protein